MDRLVIRKLNRLSACTEAIGWAKTQPDIQTAWATCERGDWMVWLICRLVKQDSDGHKKLVLLACKIAASTLRRYYKGTDARPRHAINVARRWARDKALINEVRLAAYAAYAAAAAYDAVYAAYAAAAAAYDAVYAASAASAAASARLAAFRRYAHWARTEFTAEQIEAMLMKR